MRRTIEAIVFLVVLSLTILTTFAWISSRGEQRRLQSTLAAQKMLLDSANTREGLRDAGLKTTLTQLDQPKRAKQTPEQIVRTLSQYLSLPRPLTLSGSSKVFAMPVRSDSKLATTQETPPLSAPYQVEQKGLVVSSSSFALDPSAQLPVDDLKPLYNYVQDCRACGAQLAVATQNAADDSVKIAA